MSENSGGGGGGAAPWPLASLKRRFGALLLDWLLCLLVSGFLGSARHPWLPTVVLIVEYAFFVGLFGQTPGMRVARISCVSATGGRPIGVLRALVRGALLALLVPALIMDGYWRGLHDRAVGSVMVAVDPSAAMAPRGGDRS